MMKQVLLLLSCLIPTALLAQNVSSVQIQQNKSNVVVSYYVDQLADIQVFFYLNNRIVPCSSLTGDVGQNIDEGYHTITWNVLADREEMIGNLSCEVKASMATRTAQNIMNKQLREARKQKRMENIYPIAGLDIHGGYAGLGAGVFWPWVTSRPTRVGSYLSWTWGLKDWSKYNAYMFNNLFAGITVRMSKHVSWFVAPGLSILDYDDSDESAWSRLSSYTEDAKYWGTGYSSSDSNPSFSETSERTEFKFAVETGLSFRFSAFMFNVRFNYPYYIGVGLGLDFSSFY